VSQSYGVRKAAEEEFNGQARRQDEVTEGAIKNCEGAIFFMIVKQWVSSFYAYFCIIYFTAVVV